MRIFTGSDGAALGRCDLAQGLGDRALTVWVLGIVAFF